MQKVYDCEEEIIGSDILEIEISKIINDEKRNDVEGVYRSLISDVVEIDERIKTRADFGDIREDDIRIIVNTGLYIWIGASHIRRM